MTLTLALPPNLNSITAASSAVISHPAYAIAGLIDKRWKRRAGGTFRNGLIFQKTGGAVLIEPNAFFAAPTSRKKRF
jgi:hypothetical protein